jgi:hypothetical protein
MRASEFVVEKKKRKRRPRWAAYGPGPYGGYGYDTGYSGDGGGGDGGGESINRGMAEGSEIKIPTEDGITMQDIRLIAGEGALTKKTVLQAIAVIRKQRRPQGVAENFADGKNPQDKGDSKRHGINTKSSVSSLRKTAKQGGRKGQLAHWLANMKAGRAKKNK